MSEPAAFVVIRDGEKRYYADSWANTYLFRELLWGPDSLEQWVASDEELGEWDYEFDGGAVIDFDQRRLTWYGASEVTQVQRVYIALNRLLQQSWPGYEIVYAGEGVSDLARAAGEEPSSEFSSVLKRRCETVKEAAGIYDSEPGEVDDDEEDPDDEATNNNDDGISDGEIRAWLTAVNSNGTVRHWHLRELSQDILSASETALTQLSMINTADVPDEAWVKEGMWIDRPRKHIGYWGGTTAQSVVPIIQNSWKGWSVSWTDNGYAEQCRVSGPGGIPMSNEQAVAKIVPIALSVKRVDTAALLGALGGELKKTVYKGVGCLMLILCSPVLLFGLISGNLKAAGITIAVIVAMVVIAYKVIARKFKRKFAPLSMNRANPNKAPVAGPLDLKQRRSKLEKLVLAAGFPALAEIEKHVKIDADLANFLR